MPRRAGTRARAGGRRWVHAGCKRFRCQEHAEMHNCPLCANAVTLLMTDVHHLGLGTRSTVARRGMNLTRPRMTKLHVQNHYFMNQYYLKVPGSRELEIRTFATATVVRAHTSIIFFVFDSFSSAALAVPLVLTTDRDAFMACIIDVTSFNRAHRPEGQGLL
eukprot:COSAG02_NODE_8449_length_2567_cov_37.228930_2_plen_162_part_00